MEVVKGSNNARRGAPPTSQILVMSVTSPQNGIPPTTLRGGVKGSVIQALSSAVWWSKELYTTHIQYEWICLFSIAAGH